MVVLVVVGLVVVADELVCGKVGGKVVVDEPIEYVANMESIMLKPSSADMLLIQLELYLK